MSVTHSFCFSKGGRFPRTVLLGMILWITSHSIHPFLLRMERLNIRELIIYSYLYSQLLKEMGLKIQREHNERKRQMRRQ